VSITVLYDNSFKTKLLEIWTAHHCRQSVLCVSEDCVHVPFADIGECFSICFIIDNCFIQLQFYDFQTQD